jgi:predicted acyltransferase
MQNIQPIAPASGTRLRSLDIFRGITIAVMIIVNNPGIETHVYPVLEHAAWNGLTLADLVFPSFIFIMGVSIVLSYSGQQAKGLPVSVMLRKTFRRALILFVLGVLLSVLPYFDIANYRIPGVLQRIALVYAACAPLFLFTSWKTQARLAAILLIGYWLLMTLVPTPGYGHPILEPGKNLAAWLDARVIPGRFWQGTWDPEGILSTLPAIASGICGMLAGCLIRTTLTPERKIMFLYLAGFIAFAFANTWNLCFPINKNLWTSSFVLYVAGLDAMILASLYFLVDILGRQKSLGWARAFGANAIAAYLVAEVLGDILTFRPGDHEHGTSITDWIMNHIVAAGCNPEIASLLWAILFTALCFIPIRQLYRKKIFLKI